jgi:hypothetical protein
METLEELIASDHVFYFHSPINPTHKGYRQVLEGFAAAFPTITRPWSRSSFPEGDFIVNPPMQLGVVTLPT